MPTSTSWPPAAARTVKDAFFASLQQHDAWAFLRNIPPQRRHHYHMDIDRLLPDADEEIRQLQQQMRDRLRQRVRATFLQHMLDRTARPIRAHLPAALWTDTSRHHPGQHRTATAAVRDTTK